MLFVQSCVCWGVHSIRSLAPPTCQSTVINPMYISLVVTASECANCWLQCCSVAPTTCQSISVSLIITATCWPWPVGCNVGGWHFYNHPGLDSKMLANLTISFFLIYEYNHKIWAENWGLVRSCDCLVIPVWLMFDSKITFQWKIDNLLGRLRYNTGKTNMEGGGGPFLHINLSRLPVVTYMSFILFW